MRTTIRAICLSAALIGGVNFADSALACPMCKGSMENNTDPAMAARPKAYMYSILFMLSMPPTLATVFGISFYRLSKRQNSINESLLNQFEEDFTDKA